MSTLKIHRLLLLLAFDICVFMFIDACFLPAESSKEEVIYKSTHQSTRKRFRKTRKIETLETRYTVDLSFYNYVNVGDYITVERSLLTKAVQKISIEKDGEINNQGGFIRGGYGLVFTSFVALAAIIFFIAYKLVKNEKHQKSLTYFLFICSLVLLLFHIGIF